MLVVGRRNAKNARKGPSSADEMQKTPKNSFSYPYDEQKTLKTAFRRGTINKKRQKQPFVGYDGQKTLKIGFRPWPKSRKQQKKRFGRGRKTKNGENCISATAESLKMKKNCVSATAEE